MHPIQMTRQAVILAGGFGTRLKAVFGDIPKPMAPLAGKPVLQHLIEHCGHFGFNDILLLVHHQHEIISSHFKDGNELGVRIQYHIESEPRGTAGALVEAKSMLDSRFLVLYGDTYVDVDLNVMWTTHKQSGADATLLIHPNSHPHDSDIVDVDKSGFVRAIHPYPHPEGVFLRNRVNAALYVMNRDVFDSFEHPHPKPDIAKHLFPWAMEQGKSLFAYESVEYIKDMGTPERITKVERDIEAGIPTALSNRGKRKAVFLDRDGTLNTEVGHLRHPDQLELMDGVAAAVKRLNQSGYVTIVATNQPVIARGDVTTDGLEEIHAKLDAQLGKEGAYVDRIRYCPHHPDRGYPGEIPELKGPCRCRKPEPGLLTDSISELTIDPTQSWMIGDTTTDMEAGRRAGVNTILLRTGFAGDDRKFLPGEVVMPNLSQAVEWILEGHPAMSTQVLPIIHDIGSERLVLIGGLARSGKSSISHIMKEQLGKVGKTAHVICLDGWLHPVASRPEGLGVLERFNMEAATHMVSTILNATEEITVSIPVYDRKQRVQYPHPDVRTIRPTDILIVEGVTALLWSEMVSLTTMTVFADIHEPTRRQRIQEDYTWRGLNDDQIQDLLASRNIDETADVLNSGSTAHFRITYTPNS